MCSLPIILVLGMLLQFFLFDWKLNTTKVKIYQELNFREVWKSIFFSFSCVQTTRENLRQQIVI
jgi:hypothetical protein